MANTTPTGYKRIAATILTPIIASLQASPEPMSQFAALVLSGVAGFLGIVGVAQGAANKSLKQYLIPTVGAGLAVLMLILPPDSPHQDTVKQVALLLAGGAIGSKYGEKQEKVAQDKITQLNLDEEYEINPKPEN